MSPIFLRRTARAAAVLGVLWAVSSLVVPGATFAADSQVKLVLKPLNQTGAWFDLTMQPGETRDLAVEIGNAGSEAVAARTYAADVYTIINGGFGARLRNDPQTGVTKWLDYASGVVQLPADQAIQRTFSISVPAGTKPGEYVTSLVLENDQPVAGTGTIVLNQFLRQAVAVVVTTPGTRSPGLAIGAASHEIVAGKSVVAIAVTNLGNIRLKPVATFTLSDDTGTQVSHAVVPMDTFYASTASSIEVPLATLLEPGTYTVDLVLEDALQNVRVEATRTFVVGAAIQPEAVGGAAPPLADVSQQPAGLQTSASWMGIAIVGLVFGVAGLGLLGLAWRRRRGQRGATDGSRRN